MIDDATIQLPGRKCGASPPATPKLMMLRHPLSMARLSEAATSFPVSRQMTNTPGPAAMRASKANPTRAMTKRSAGGGPIFKESGRTRPTISLLAGGMGRPLEFSPKHQAKFMPRQRHAYYKDAERRC